MALSNVVALVLSRKKIKPPFENIELVPFDLFDLENHTTCDFLLTHYTSNVIITIVWGCVETWKRYHNICKASSTIPRI